MIYLCAQGYDKFWDRVAGRTDLGVMLNPRHGVVHWQRLTTGPWAMDNGAFSAKGFDSALFLRYMERPILADAQETCLFATAPDALEIIASEMVNKKQRVTEVRGDPQGTLRLFDEWEPLIRERGYRVAMVASDGSQDLLERFPWGTLDCVFLGGSTGWKLGEDARRIVVAARAEGKWVHMGRVNSWGRLRVAMRMGCDSADGSFLSFAPDRNLEKIISWMDRLANERDQMRFA